VLIGTVLWTVIVVPLGGFVVPALIAVSFGSAASIKGWIEIWCDRSLPRDWEAESQSAKRTEPGLANHQMVDDVDAENLTGPAQLGGERDIGARWRWVTGGMVVDNHDSRRVQPDRILDE
jgi:hypothetical protein